MKHRTLLMLDTETVTNARLPYDVAFVTFDDSGIISEESYYVRECLDYVLRYTARHGKPPLYWPDRMNPVTIRKAKHCLPAIEILSRFNNAASAASAVVAHNVAFDLAALAAMAEKWCDGEKVGKYPTKELSAFFPDFLQADYAEKVPYTKTGLATFKADFFMPLLGDLVQGHDALGDVRNQITIYQMVKDCVYSGKRTIYHNMLHFQQTKVDDKRFLGIGFIPGISDDNA